MKNVLVAVAALALFSSTCRAADYTIDADHSTVGFKVRHLAISSVAGSFGKFTGSFSYNPTDLSQSTVEASIDTKSINTSQQKRDDHLRGEDFLFTDKFSTISFKSKEIKDGTPESFKVVGDLTIRGVTKPVVLDVSLGGVAKDMYGNERAAFSAIAKINRKDFGLTWNKLLETGALVVGDEVQIALEIEGIKKAGA